MKVGILIPRGVNSRTYILPVLLYGCKTWTVSKTLAKRLDAFETWCLRKVLRIPYTRHTTSDTLYEPVNNSPESFTCHTCYNTSQLLLTTSNLQDNYTRQLHSINIYHICTIIRLPLAAELSQQLQIHHLIR